MYYFLGCTLPKHNTNWLFFSFWPHRSYKREFIWREKNPKILVLRFFNPNFLLPWSYLLPFSTGFVAAAPGKQWRRWEARFCGESKRGEKALPRRRLIFSTFLSATCNAVRRFRGENALVLVLLEGWCPFNNRLAVPKNPMLRKTLS